MEETIVTGSLLERSRKNMLAYFDSHDVQYIAEDAVYHNMNTGEVFRGRAEIGAMLHYFYHIAFEARPVYRNYIIDADKAVVEGFVTGRHTGTFAGIPATGREVQVPICVTYELRDNLIAAARIYLLGDVLMQQLGTGMLPKTTYIVRDIFQLKFGQFREAKALLQEAAEGGLLPESGSMRVLSDFTGDAYRLIFEEGFPDLATYEASLSGSMKTAAWQDWYSRFKPLVERSHREILKGVI